MVGYVKVIGMQIALQCRMLNLFNQLQSEACMASNEVSAVKRVKKGGAMGLVTFHALHQVLRLHSLDADSSLL